MNVPTVNYAFGIWLDRLIPLFSDRIHRILGLIVHGVKCLEWVLIGWDSQWGRLGHAQHNFPIAPTARALSGKIYQDCRAAVSSVECFGHSVATMANLGSSCEQKNMLALK
jgi:hypothetical protein